MINRAALAEVAILGTKRLRLEPHGIQHIDGLIQSINNPETMRLTGTHDTFTREQIRRYLEGLPGRHDRADWAIIRTQDECYLGEVVLNQLEAENESMNLRIALGSEFGLGYGTEAVRAAVAYGLDVIGLHRISLQVYEFNTRAQRAYEKCGFLREGVARDALLWDGTRSGAILMSILDTDPRPAFEQVIEVRARLP